MERIGKSRRYSTTAEGVATLTAYSILRDQVIKPLLAGFIRRQGRPPKLIHLSICSLYFLSLSRSTDKRDK